MSESRLSFMAMGRKRRLYRNSTNGSYFVRFMVNGRDTPRSLGTTEIEAARAKAKFMIEDAYAAAKGDNAAAERMSRKKFATIGEIVDRYQPHDVSPTTATQNRAKFLRMVRVGLDVADPRAVSAELLKDDQIVKAYQRAQSLAVLSADANQQAAAAISTNSTLRQARSVLAAERLHLYADLRLPDLTRFRAAPMLRVDADVSFVPFPDGTVERIEELLETMPRDVRLTTLLMLRCGLRNREVEHAKWEWFRKRDDGTVELSIERRAYFKVKNRSVRTLRLPADLTAQLRLFWGASDDWVIERPTATERYEATHDEINAWLRPVLPDRTKCAYELRKHAGSVILTRPESEGGGLAAAARFLGDSIATTEKHYARYLRPVTAIGAVEARARFNVVKLA